MEMTHDRLNAGVDADIFGTASASDIDGIVVCRLCLAEGFVQRIEMAIFLGISLVAFEIMQRRLDVLSGFAVRAYDMNRMANGVHALFENENLIFLGEVAHQHQYLFTRHHQLSHCRFAAF